MKRIILNIIVILSLFYCNASFSQTLEKPLRIKSQRSNSRRPQRLKQDEFVNRRSPLKDIFTVAPCYVNCDVAGSKGDLRFTTSSPSSFNVILSNHNSIVRAARKSYRAWHRKQLNVIKNKLDSKFGKKFSNYNEAKNMMFADSERKNIIKSVNIAKPKYSNLKSNGFRKQKEHKKKLKFLRLRENEIKAGNINNSKYGFIKVGNVYLKDLKSTKALKKHWDPLVLEFSENTATTHINNYIYKAFSKTGVNSVAVSAKNNYYNRLNDWDKLDFMQFLINYEYYKKYNSPPYAHSAKMSRLFKKFNKLEVATPSLVENYAIKNRDGGISVFDDNYWKIILNGYPGLERIFFEKRAKKEHRRLKKQKLNKLLAAESTAEFAIANLIGELGVSNQSQKNWLYKYKTKANELIKFANDNRVGGKISSKEKFYIMEFLNITNDIPKANFLRYKELKKLIKKSPFALLEDCMNDNGLSIDNYIKLYEHTLPYSCISRLNKLGNDFKDQPLSQGNAVAANVDYYGVEVKINPDFDKNGVPDTNAQVYKKYRETFTTLASGGKKDFQFSCKFPGKGDVSWKFLPYFTSDLTKWKSSSPITAIFKIDANADIFMGSTVSDDGAIMISKYTSNYWIGSTIQTKFSGTQPFSGNRQWGKLINQNGNLELFARAVDVARLSATMKNTSLIPLVGGNDKCKEETYYDIGEATWSNLQENIKNWINVNGGQATIVPKVAIRFDRKKLKEILEGNKTIDQIKCN